MTKVLQTIHEDPLGSRLIHSPLRNLDQISKSVRDNLISVRGGGGKGTLESLAQSRQSYNVWKMTGEYQNIIL